MNHPRSDDPSAHPSAGPDEREWQAQERARIDARDGTPPAADDEARAHARIARALRAAPPDRLPSNFAFQVAQLAGRLPRRAPLDLRLERWLLRALAVAMAIGALASTAVYGVGWLRTLDAAGPGVATWVLLLAAGMLPTLGAEAWRALRVAAQRER